MSKPFTISFGFPLENSTEKIQITAMAELHHSTPYYVIDSFHFDGENYPPGAISLLPPVEIEYVQEEKKSLWIHRDSKRTSHLSLAIGKAIEQSGHLEF